MKKFIAAGLMLASLNVFSQSYLILSNGITLTTDKAGFIYDFGHFHLPYQVGTTGLNYFIEDKKLSTVDENGFLYEKSIKADKLKKIKGKGGNFFLNDDNRLFTIDAKGFFYEYEDEKVFKKITTYGGNYFLVQQDKKKPLDLYTVNNKGNYYKITVPGLNPSDIVATTGNYFQSKTGTVYTVSSEGFVFPKYDMKVGKIVKGGGNYFVDSNNLLFTVNENGLLILPILPANLRVADIKNYGANYVIDGEGRVFTINNLGEMNERFIPHDLRNSKILSQVK